MSDHDGGGTSDLGAYLQPLNGPFEVGLRALTILSSGFPQTFDITSLTLLEYSLLHSSDFGGPESLHPEVPNYRSEIAVTRDLLEQGLEVMMRARLVALEVHHGGICYVATENAPGFVDLLESEYMVQLRERAQWAVQSLGSKEGSELQDDLHELLQAAAELGATGESEPEL